MAARDKAILRLLERFGIPKPTSTEFMLAVLIKSIEDWMRTVKQQRKQRGEFDDDD